ncbi:fasciclin domain-containing protein [Actinokineospora cianjurensis]|uniref:Putative surface protein with fasciclin (FAS1) repeats n=1 Tax=Actinokineospora cianjurensis TaxID=585224 RepID=A0A421B8B1_9PSEU|nr:fasciclin domain-containing protein [Actinokineospora cianjurensis]RLK60651.1 putative surface protein with fasciclin (FAS1) repeats [Actinokineospora cianjurensis]
MSNLKPVLGVAVVVASLVLSACSSKDSAGGASTAAAATTTAAAPSSQAGAMAASDGVTTAADTFGPNCKDLPQGDAAGGLTSMGPQPVATAASTNPLLTKLVAAVKAIPGLVDTLNTTDNLTVFAPADPAFAALGDAKFAELAANPAALAPILQFHVIPKRYDRDGLVAAGTVKSLNAAGGDIKIEGTGDNITINGAKVLCGNIPTKNATVFVIDTVLTPKG